MPRRSPAVLSRVAVALALTLAVGSAPLVAAPPPETVAIDRAQEALAAGDPARAIRLLRDVADLADPDARSRVRCLLGAALLRDGQPDAAGRALADVPLDAACGLRAGFLRAE
ncbi:MAG: hypothetical protein ABMB14_31455, partial [Myxococcota bacterium]